MELTGETVINAPQDAVYDALGDAVILRRAVPGVERLTRTDAGRIAVTATVTVGSERRTIEATGAEYNVDRPAGCSLRGEASTSTGTVRFAAHVALAPVDPRTTSLAYHVTAEPRGALSVAEAAAARAFVADVFERLRLELEVEQPMRPVRALLTRSAPRLAQAERVPDALRAAEPLRRIQPDRIAEPLRVAERPRIPGADDGALLQPAEVDAPAHYGEVRRQAPAAVAWSEVPDDAVPWSRGDEHEGQSAGHAPPRPLQPTVGARPQPTIASAPEYAEPAPARAANSTTDATGGLVEGAASGALRPAGSLPQTPYAPAPFRNGERPSDSAVHDGSGSNVVRWLMVAVGIAAIALLLNNGFSSLPF